MMSIGGDTLSLPKEIIEEILKRLPVKSLIRLQCVCKQWKHLIKSPSFIADHLHHSTRQNPSLLLSNVENMIISEPLHLRLIDCEMHVRQVQNHPWIGSLSGVSIIGSCNGLLCVVIEESDESTPPCFWHNSLLLWNPSIGEVREIPRCRTSEYTERDCYGFGFSAILNDYKIVQTYHEGDEVARAVEVYSLSTGLWKEIELGGLEGIIIQGNGVNANGCIFWDGEKLEEFEEGNYLIVSFDMATEVFTLISGPPLSNGFTFVLTVYEGRLAILSISCIADFQNDFYFINLWVLDDGIGLSSERWSWTKKFTSNPFPPTLQLPGTIWRNEIVIGTFGKPGGTNESGCRMKNDEEVGIYLINIITNELKMLAVPMEMYGYDLFNYVESLVPTGGNNYLEEP